MFDVWAQPGWDRVMGGQTRSIAQDGSQGTDAIRWRGYDASVGVSDATWMQALELCADRGSV
jgi:hypothetical protein